MFSSEQDRFFSACYNAVKEIEFRAKQNDIPLNHASVIAQREAISIVVSHMGYSLKDFLFWVLTNRSDENSG